MNTSSSPFLPLDPWRSRQAAMLHHYSSLTCLQELHALVSGLIDDIVDPILDLAKYQNRDAVLTDQRWGDRNTSENWSNHAWPFLKDLQADLSRDIALRQSGHYSVTAVNECLRGMDQYSMAWATEDEVRRYQEIVKMISRHGISINYTLDTDEESRWTDFGFSYHYPGFVAHSPRIPRFRVRTDIVGENGKLPPQTGVYVAVDDPNASVQFAWTGGGGCALRMASTFNDIGLAALSAVGRQDLWFNEQKMFDFAIASPHASLFERYITSRGTKLPTLAPSAVARSAFTARACKWNLVEIIPDQYEDTMLNWNSIPVPSVSQRLEGGETCKLPGYYFSPARPSSRRRFDAGETMPIFDCEYGKTVWQWDDNQST